MKARLWFGTADGELNEEELASLALSYYNLRLGIGDDRVWCSTEGNVGWLAEEGKKMVEGGYVWHNEPGGGLTDGC